MILWEMRGVYLHKLWTRAAPLQWKSGSCRRRAGRLTGAHAHGRGYFTASAVNQFGSIKVTLADNWAGPHQPDATNVPGDQPAPGVGSHQEDVAVGFASALADAVRRWREEGVRGVWLEVPVGAFGLVPACRRLGFLLHHCDGERDTLLLNKWLLSAEHPNTMPRFASHTVGVAGCVLDPSSQQVLLIRDRSRPEIWKLPGGFSEPSEDIAVTAVREVWEETGVRAEFQSVLAFRQHHKVPSSFNASDLYVICRMQLAESATALPVPVACEREVVECRWRPLQEVMAERGPSVTPLLRRILQLLQMGLQHGFDAVDLPAVTLPSVYPGHTYTLFHRALQPP